MPRHGASVTPLRLASEAVAAGLPLRLPRPAPWIWP